MRLQCFDSSGRMIMMLSEIKHKKGHASVFAD
jgi:hypothetical protein